MPMDEIIVRRTPSVMKPKNSSLARSSSEISEKKIQEDKAHIVQEPLYPFRGFIDRLAKQIDKIK
jgi:hypothetical protein